jgi:capsular polysaccharide transport system permease protein
LADRGRRYATFGKLMSDLTRQTARSDPGFFYAVRRYGQILFALLQREQESRRRAPIESIMDVLEPIILVTLFGILWSFLNRRASSPLGDHSLLFIGTGFYAKFFWINLSRMTRMTVGTPSRRFPVERRLDYILIHLLLTTGNYVVLGFAAFAILYSGFTASAIPHNFVPVVQAMLAIVALGFGWGVITLVMSKYFWPWPYVAAAFNRAMILFSGIFFLAEFLPPYARAVMGYNPMLHAVALFRTGFYPNYPTGLLDTTYLLYCSIFAVFIGIVLERVTLRSEA